MIIGEKCHIDIAFAEKVRRLTHTESVQGDLGLCGNIELEGYIKIGE